MKSLLFFTTSLVLILSSCTAPSQPADIITTVFAHYDLTRLLIQGTNIHVSFPITPGQDVHDWQPTAQDIQAFYDAQLIILNGLDLEPWSDQLLEQPELDAEVLILSDYVTLREGHDHEEHVINVEPLTLEEEVYDPHYWLDPHNAIAIVTILQERLFNLFPESQSTIEENANVLLENLTALEEAFAALIHEEETMDDHDPTALIFAGHNAFGYWLNYGIEFVTPYEDFSASTAPTAAQILELTTLLETYEEPIIFASLLEGLAIAETLQDQFPTLQIHYLSTLENVKTNELDTVSYVSLMQDNLTSLGLAIHD